MAIRAGSRSRCEATSSSRPSTDAAHRRRGLGRAMMSALAEAAVSQGARTGLLIASEEGQRPCSSLGWHHKADVLIARGSTVPAIG
ncbi:GNAT family N-acetyltransferase [Streptomyces sp. NPDC093228]|uniref:GNAT family N-acetyltransferase n=1 Tax=unclassified Streptomyces TaxID=2593676 RepID=UPI002B413457|nr:MULTISPECIES: GNAT family N-acetyltransferase [unclassified Streptomyces]